jgi:hypothetical protein
MKIYGYAKSKISHKGLLELREITFSGSPESIRQVGRFLLSAAEQMEKDAHRFTHLHVRDAIKQWLEKWPDVIVSE